MSSTHNTYPYTNYHSGLIPTSQHNNYMNYSNPIVSNPTTIVDNNSFIINNTSNAFSYQTQKPFSKLNSNYLPNPININMRLNNNQNYHNNHKDTHNNKSLTTHTVTKPNSSSLAQQKRAHQTAYEVEENLAKTVKHSVGNYKKTTPQISNLDLFKASSIYGDPHKPIPQPQNIWAIPHQQNIQSLSSNNISSSNNNISSSNTSDKQQIMSIDQIREIQKKQFIQNTIHKITSSASRNKLKTSSSKDSKASSVNVQSKSIKLKGQQTQRYNKYINNELISINIDLRRDPNANIISQNPNIRRFGTAGVGSEIYQNQYHTGRLEKSIHQHKPLVQQISRSVSSQANYSQFIPPNLSMHKKTSQNQELTCKDSVPREDKHLPQRIKTRSKSNLSRYSQLKDSNPQVQECLLNCSQKVDLSKSRETEIVIRETYGKPLQRESLPVQKSQKKIHFVSYSEMQKNKEKTSQIIPNNSQQYQTQTYQKNLLKDNKLSEMQKIPISISGVRRTQQVKKDRPQTDRKSITNFNIYPKSDVQGEANGLSKLIEEKMRKKPIRLTIQK